MSDPSLPAAAAAAALPAAADEYNTTNPDVLKKLMKNISKLREHYGTGVSDAKTAAEAALAEANNVVSQSSAEAVKRRMESNKALLKSRCATEILLIASEKADDIMKVVSDFSGVVASVSMKSVVSQRGPRTKIPIEPIKVDLQAFRDSIKTKTTIRDESKDYLNKAVEQYIADADAGADAAGAADADALEQQARHAALTKDGFNEAAADAILNTLKSDPLYLAIQAKKIANDAAVFGGRRTRKRHPRRRRHTRRQ
jgi:hypothetical protein